MRSLAAQFDRSGGRPAGFDYLRFALAVLITAYHTFVVCYGAAPEEELWSHAPARAFLCFFVPCFFALSGFLVARSLLSNSLPGFLTLRAARIFPALICIVLVSALIIGPALTAVPAQAYFSGHEFYTYFLNMGGFIHYTLPGLFHDNPFPDIVNIQLWTIPYELQCYILLAILSILRVVQKPRLFVLVFCAVSFLAFAYSAFWAGFDLHRTAPSGRTCMLAFSGGVVLYIWRKKIPHSPALFVAAILAAAALFASPRSEYFGALPVAYVTVWLGLLNPKRLPFVAGADYSYGIYLYGFAIQQSVMQISPMHQAWYWNLGISLAFTWLAAFASWHLLESRVLGKKKRAVAAVENFSKHLAAFRKAIVPKAILRFWNWMLGFGDILEDGLLQLEKIIFKASS